MRVGPGTGRTSTGSDTDGGDTTGGARTKDLHLQDCDDDVTDKSLIHGITGESHLTGLPTGISSIASVLSIAMSQFHLFN